jgi:hypothetical protein
MTADEYGLLKAFRSLFEGTQYLHRDSSLGDWVASYLYEDLFKLRKSSKLNKRIAAGVRVLNTQNRTVGIAPQTRRWHFRRIGSGRDRDSRGRARRGSGTSGHVCGSIMVRNGSCHECMSCGSTSGCS